MSTANKEKALLEMRMNIRAGLMLASAFSLALSASVATAAAEELSEKAVVSFMDYAWSLTPGQFSKPDGTVVQIDKKKRDDVMVPLDVARDIIMAGRLSAHAQVCDLKAEQVDNQRALMRREVARQKWSQQQLVYINQLHLTTVMLLTGKIKLVEKQGDKQVVVEEGKVPAQTCTQEQKQKVAELIKAYVTASPAAPAAPAAAAPAAAASAAAPTSTGSTTPAAAKPAAAAPQAAAAKPAAQPEAAPAASKDPAPEKK